MSTRPTSFTLMLVTAGAGTIVDDPRQSPTKRTP
jgi:hypothetical protein